MLQTKINSFKYALKGLRTTWTEEHNFRFEVLCAVIVMFCIYFFHFTLVESLFCILAITLVLSAEIVNTVVEDLCNKMQPEYDSAIGKIKDTMAAFVFVTVIGALIVGVLVFYTHFLK